MIAATTQALIACLADGQPANVRVVADRPLDRVDEPTLCVSALHLERAPGLREPTAESADWRPALDYRLRYAVTAYGKDALEEQALMDGAIERLATASQWSPAAPLAPNDWRALGVAMRLALIVEATFVHAREPAPVAPVTEKAELLLTPTQPLVGKVVTPAGTPVTDAQVSLPYARLTTRTDATGTFRFSNAPAGRAARRIVVTARGRRAEASADEAAIITLQPGD